MIPKYRAWDKVSKKMYEVKGLAWVDGIIMRIDIESRNDVVEWREALDFILMQFTGIHDKNKKEIYENDILSYPREKQVISVYWDITHGGFQFNEHRGFDDGVGRGDWNFTMGIANNSEVIGDVHTTPHLLTNTK